MQAMSDGELMATLLPHIRTRALEAGLTPQVFALLAELEAELREEIRLRPVVEPVQVSARQEGSLKRVLARMSLVALVKRFPTRSPKKIQELLDALRRAPSVSVEWGPCLRL